MPAITTTELLRAAELARYEPTPGDFYPGSAGPSPWQHAQTIALVSIAESLDAIRAHLEGQEPS